MHLELYPCEAFAQILDARLQVHFACAMLDFVSIRNPSKLITKRVLEYSVNGSFQIYPGNMQVVSRFTGTGRGHACIGPNKRSHRRRPARARRSPAR